MHVTLGGMVMLFSSQQDANAPLQILVTLYGILTLVSSLHRSNAYVPMHLIPSGIVMSPEQVLPSIRMSFTDL